MRHITRDELVLHYYGEHDDPAGIATHLDDCARCRGEQEALVALLDAVVEQPIPDRSEGYGAEVWARVNAALETRPAAGRWSWVTWPRLGLAATAAVLILAAFLAGQRQGRIESIEALSKQERRQLLMAAVGEHLEQSRRMLVELGNAEVRHDVDLSERRPVAARLASRNRIYRATATTAGQTTVADLLEQLERVLLEIANSPDTLSPGEFNDLWRRIESSTLLLRMRLVETETRRRT